MELNLKGKNVIVLGGTRGIGLATAQAFADEGANVAVCARTAESVAKRVAELRARGARATGAAVDVADGANLQAWIRSVAEELGGIDVLVSNAGAMAQGFGTESWEMNFRVDVLAASNAFEAAQPFLKIAADANGDAAVVLVGSIASTESAVGGSYGAMKAALTHLSKSLAIAHAKDHIRVNVVSPGMIDFEGAVWQAAKQHAPDLYKTVRDSVRLGHPGEPKHIADAIVFLCSPRSFFTTGANLLIDGGQSNRVTY